MAKYEHLSVFKISYEYMIEIYNRTKNFPKEYKYTIGEEIKKVSLDLILGIHQINSEENKTEK